MDSVGMLEKEKDSTVEKEEEEKLFYKEAFDAFDWNRNGTIPTGVSVNSVNKVSNIFCDILYLLGLVCAKTYPNI